MQETAHKTRFLAWPGHDMLDLHGCYALRSTARVRDAVCSSCGGGLDTSGYAVDVGVGVILPIGLAKRRLRQ